MVGDNKAHTIRKLGSIVQAKHPIVHDKYNLYGDVLLLKVDHLAYCNLIYQLFFAGTQRNSQVSFFVDSHVGSNKGKHLQPDTI